MMNPVTRLQALQYLEEGLVADGQISSKTQLRLK